MYKTRLHRFNCSTKIQTLNALPCKVSILNNARLIVQIHNIALLKTCEAVPLRYFAKTNTTHCLTLLKSCEAVLLRHFVLANCTFAKEIRTKLLSVSLHWFFTC